MSSQSLLSELGLLNVRLITLKLIACVTAINSMTFTCFVINKNIYNYVFFNPSIFFTTFPPKGHRGRRHNVSDRIRLAHLQSIVDSRPPALTFTPLPKWEPSYHIQHACLRSLGSNQWTLIVYTGRPQQTTKFTPKTFLLVRLPVNHYTTVPFFKYANHNISQAAVGQNLLPKDWLTIIQIVVDLWTLFLLLHSCKLFCGEMYNEKIITQHNKTHHF